MWWQRQGFKQLVKNPTSRFPGRKCFLGSVLLCDNIEQAAEELQS